MSGEAEEARDRRRPSAPIPFTDDEVRELAGGRERSVAAVRRLKRVVPSGPIGKLESELPTLADADAHQPRRDHTDASSRSSA